MEGRPVAEQSVIDGQPGTSAVARKRAIDLLIDKRFT
jgi:hypothetical protein